MKTELNRREPLVLDERVEMVSFTGSTAVGARILEKTAHQIKRVSLELGGKNPAIVFADADFDKAVSECVRSAFTNSGQVCLCTERTFVHESIYDDFVAACIKEAAKWTVGDPRKPGVRLGPLGKTFKNYYLFLNCQSEPTTLRESHWDARSCF